MKNFNDTFRNFDYARYADSQREVYKRIYDVLVPNFVGKPFTVRDVGEYMMGDDYHRQEYDCVVRNYEARSLTASITALLRSMVGNGVKSYEKRDMAHPRTVETEEICWECDGVRYPQFLPAMTTIGIAVEVPAQKIFPNGHPVIAKVQKTVYPKVTYYEFV